MFSPQFAKISLASTEKHLVFRASIRIPRVGVGKADPKRLSAHNEEEKRHLRIINSEI